MNNFRIPNLADIEEGGFLDEKWVQFIDSKSDGRLLISLEKKGIHREPTGRIVVTYPEGRTRSISKEEAQFYFDEGTWSVIGGEVNV